MQAPKNGFFYVLDRATGEFLSGTPYVAMNWATGIDEKGRPIDQSGGALRHHRQTGAGDRQARSAGTIGSR